jgi:hypothetical protein
MASCIECVREKVIKEPPSNFLVHVFLRQNRLCEFSLWTLTPGTLGLRVERVPICC